MSYKPKPVDISGVGLSRETLELTEPLARSNPDIRAESRLAGGWTCALRNDALKQNPCLVPYEDLPDSEKEYDRWMVV